MKFLARLTSGRTFAVTMALLLGCSASIVAPSASPSASSPASPSPTASAVASPGSTAELPAGIVEIEAPVEQTTLMLDRVADAGAPRLVLLARMLATTPSPAGASAPLRPGTTITLRDGQRTQGAAASVSCQSSGDRPTDVLNVPPSAFVHVWCQWFSDDPAITALSPGRTYDVEVEVAAGTSKWPIRVMRVPIRTRTHADPAGRFIMTFPERWALGAGTGDRVAIASDALGCELDLMSSSDAALPAGQRTEIEIGMRRYPAVLTSTPERDWVLESSAETFGARWRIRAACRRVTQEGTEEIRAFILPLWRRP